MGCERLVWISVPRFQHTDRSRLDCFRWQISDNPAYRLLLILRDGIVRRMTVLLVLSLLFLVVLGRIFTVIARQPWKRLTMEAPR